MGEEGWMNRRESEIELERGDKAREGIDVG